MRLLFLGCIRCGSRTTDPQGLCDVCAEPPVSGPARSQVQVRVRRASARPDRMRRAA